MKKVIIIVYLVFSLFTVKDAYAEFNYDKFEVFLDKYDTIFGNGVDEMRSYTNVVAAQKNDTDKYRKQLVIQMLNTNYLVVMQRLEAHRYLANVHFFMDKEYAIQYEASLREQVNFTKLYAMRFSQSFKNVLETMKNNPQMEGLAPFLFTLNAETELTGLIKEISEFSSGDN